MRWVSWNWLPETLWFVNEYSALPIEIYGITDVADLHFLCRRSMPPFASWVCGSDEVFKSEHSRLLLRDSWDALSNVIVPKETVALSELKKECWWNQRCADESFERSKAPENDRLDGTMNWELIMIGTLYNTWSSGWLEELQRPNTLSREQFIFVLTTNL